MKKVPSPMSNADVVNTTFEWREIRRGRFLRNPISTISFKTIKPTPPKIIKEVMERLRVILFWKPTKLSEKREKPALQKAETAWKRE